MKNIQILIEAEIEKQLGTSPKMGDIKPTDEKDRPFMDNRPENGMDVDQHKKILWLNESAQNAFVPAIENFCKYAIKRWGVNQPVKIILRDDPENAKKLLGYTGHYSPEKKEIVAFTTGRSYKDIIKTIGHELVHHLQNCRGDFDNYKLQEGYAQTDPHLREMEKEAYLLSAITFRDWEDGIKNCHTEEELNEFSAVAGGAVVGYGAPLGMDMSSAHDIMWSGDKPKKKKK